VVFLVSGVRKAGSDDNDAEKDLCLSIVSSSYVFKNNTFSEWAVKNYK